MKSRSLAHMKSQGSTNSKIEPRYESQSRSRYSEKGFTGRCNPSPRLITVRAYAVWFEERPRLIPTNNGSHLGNREKDFCLDLPWRQFYLFENPGKVCWPRLQVLALIQKAEVTLNKKTILSLQKRQFHWTCTRNTSQDVLSHSWCIIQTKQPRIILEIC